MRTRTYILLIVLVVGSIAMLNASQKVDFHGFASQGYLYSSDNNYLAKTSDGTFDFNEFALNASARLTRRLHLGLQFAARDMGDVGNNAVYLDWAFADYQYSQYIGLRAGKAKTSVGLLADYWDIDAVRTNIYLPLGVYPENFRDVNMTNRGFGFYGSSGLDILGSVQYNAMIGTDNVSTDGPFARWIASRKNMEMESLDAEYKFNGSLTWETPLDGLLLKGSIIDSKFSLGLYSPQNNMTIDQDTHSTSYIGSVQFTYKNLEVSGEYLMIDIHQEYPDLPLPDSDSKIEGYYGKIDYRFNDWLQAGTYYTVYYPDADDKDGEDLSADPTSAGYRPDYWAWQKDLCLTLRFDPMPGWIVKLEGHMMNGCASMLAMDQEDTADMTKTEEDWYLLAAKLTYIF